MRERLCQETVVKAATEIKNIGGCCLAIGRKGTKEKAAGRGASRLTGRGLWSGSLASTWLWLARGGLNVGISYKGRGL